MKKRIVSPCLILALCLTLLPTTALAATPGTAGDVLTGDYVVIVNTDPDPAKVQSTGTLIFEDHFSQAQAARNMPSFSGLPDAPQGRSAAVMGLLSRSSEAASYQVNDEKTDFSHNGSNAKWICVGIGNHCYIWMEESLKAAYSENKLESIVADIISIYDGQPYELLTTLSGNAFPYADNSGKLSIVLEQTHDGSDGFYGREETITAIHVNTPLPTGYTAGAMAQKADLLVREGQRAIFHKRTGAGDDLLWLNEGLSVAAVDYLHGGEDIYDWMPYINGNVELRCGAPLVYSSYRGVTALDRALPGLFVRYLASQMSQGYQPGNFISKVYDLSAASTNNVETFMNTLLSHAGVKNANGTAMTFADALTNFYAALIAQEKTGVYGFCGDPTVATQITDYPVYMGESGTAAELPGTAAIVVKTKDGKFYVPENGGADIRYIAVTPSANTALLPADGSGTAQEPYLISTVEDLRSMAIAPDAHYKLTQNLDMAGEVYAPLVEFSGTLDGAGYTILHSVHPLIHTNKGTIRDLNIAADVSGSYQSSSVGMFAQINRGTLINCHLSGTVSVRPTDATLMYMGQYNENKLTQIVGGLVGINELTGTMSACSSTANLTASFGPYTAIVGGLAGVNNGTLENCFVSDSLTSTQNNAGFQHLVGGAVGYLNKANNATGAVLKNVCSTVEMSVTGGSQAVGRLYGEDHGLTESVDLVSCYALSGLAVFGKTNSSVAGTGIQKSAADLKKQATYANWPFGAVWAMEENGYPRFLAKSEITSVTAATDSIQVFVGEDLNLSQGLSGVTLTVTAGSDRSVINVTEDMLTASLDSSTAGEKTVTGSYKGMPFQITVNVTAPTNVSDLSVSPSATGKTVYYAGETYTMEGVQLTTTLDGKTVTIDSGFAASLQDKTLTTADATVTYTYCGKTTTQTITVKEDVPTAITVLSRPAKLDYATGETLDFSGLLVRLTYGSGRLSRTIPFEALAQEGLHTIAYKDTTEITANTVTVNENGAEFYVYYGNKTPIEAGAIAALLGKITVTEGEPTGSSSLQKLLAPTSAWWDGTTAKWSAVFGAASYRVELYRGSAVVKTIPTAETQLDLTAEITDPSDHFFRVIALGDGTTTADSRGVIGSAFTPTAMEQGQITVSVTDSNGNGRLDAGDQLTADVSVTPRGGTPFYQWKKQPFNSSPLDLDTDATYILGSDDLEGRIWCDVTIGGKVVGILYGEPLMIGDFLPNAAFDAELVTGALTGAVANLSMTTGIRPVDAVILAIRPDSGKTFQSTPTVTAVNAVAGAVTASTDGSYRCVIASFTGNAVITVSGTAADTPRDNTSLMPFLPSVFTEKLPFEDVQWNDWFYDEVKEAWENDLIDGMTADRFEPNSSLTVAQAIKLAAALHQMYNDGEVTLANGWPNWFDSYVDYAVENGIIEAKYQNYTLAQMNAPASRQEFVQIFFGAMPEAEYAAWNVVSDNAIPDVKLGDASADEIYTFYRAGILTGSDGKGSFLPKTNIKRSEVAAILIRMYDQNARQSVYLP